MISRLRGRREPGIPRSVELRSALITLRHLRRALGVPAAAAVIAEVGKDQLLGRPFSLLPRARDRREALSRRQAGPAILLYRALLRRLGKERALELTRDIVVASTLLFLDFAIGRLDRDELMSRSPAEREQYVRTIGDRFFNSTILWDEISDRRVHLTVTHCLFPGLCNAVGAPEVAPLLCAGDAVYFGDVLGNVAFTRPHTMAEGADDCPFDLKWK